MTTIGNSNTAVTLSPSAPNVTITGNITGLGGITLKGTAGSYTIDAAVQAGTGAAFQILNLGQINTGNTLSAGYAGLVLARPGQVTNDGLIEGGSGFLSASYQPGAYLNNAGTIDGATTDYGIGLAFNGQATLNNTGTIYGQKAALYLFGGGAVSNAGNITGFTGITAFNATLTNSGIIDGDAYQGVYIQGVMTNTGRIRGFNDGADLESGTITNQGYVLGQIAGIQAYNGAVITNAKTGMIAADGFHRTGVNLESGATLFNQGLITSAGTGIDDGGGGPITNAGGLIFGNDLEGIYVTQSSAHPAMVYNSGTVEGQSYGLAAIGPGAASITNFGSIVGSNSNFSGTNKAGGALGPHAYLTGIAISKGTILNAGLASGGDNGIYVLSGPGYVTNRGTIAGGNTGLAIPLGSLYNAGTGRITASTSFGIAIAAGATTDIGNAGGITAATGIQLGGGRIINTGTITGTGKFAYANSAISITGASYIYNSGQIAGATGIQLKAGATIIDKGAITGTAGSAIAFENGGANNLTLLQGASLTGTVGLYGTLHLAGSGATPGTVNLGKINAVSTIAIGGGASWQLTGAASGATEVFNDGNLTSTGIGIAGGLAVYNYGLITGAAGISSGGLYVYNSGTILATNIGIALTAPGYIINEGSISATTGISLATSASLYNYGVIIGGVTAANAALYNYAGAVISATSAIVLTAGVVGNYGTLTGTTAAVDFTTNAATNRLILAPTAVTTGALLLGGGTLELQAGAAGTLATAPQYATAITVDKRASWDLAGTFAAPALVNNGTITETASDSLTIAGALTGTGTLAFAGTLTLEGSAAATQSVAFSTSAATLVLDDPAPFAATIQNFALGDTISLAGISLSSVTSLSFAQNILTLSETAAALTLTFATGQNFNSYGFSLSASPTGTALTLAAAPGAAFTPLSPTPTFLAAPTLQP